MKHDKGLSVGRRTAWRIATFFWAVERYAERIGNHFEDVAYAKNYGWFGDRS